MAIDVKEIHKFFEDNRTEEQKRIDAEIESAWQAYDAEQDAWNNACYIGGVSGEDFRRGRETIRQRYLAAGVITPASFQ